MVFTKRIKHPPFVFQFRQYATSGKESRTKYFLCASRGINALGGGPRRRGDRVAYRKDVNNKGVVSGLRILVLEDEKDTRDLLQFLLESQGATVMVADNVLEGLEIFADQRPDIVVADIGMLEYNGYAFI